jgi:D-3-phosphoglycerate dehydrogenase
MSDTIAIIGDRFMLPSVFADRPAAACGNGVRIKTLEQPWPDQPMEHGYANPALDRLKEFIGDPDEVAEFIDDATMFVTHLAPVSRAMLERLPGLKFIAVSRGGPVNVDMQAARDRGVLVVNTPGRNASAVAEFAIGAILAETRLIRPGHEALRAGEWRAISIGQIAPAGNSAK